MEAKVAEEKVAAEFKRVFDDKGVHLKEIDRKTLKEWLRTELVDEPEHVEVYPVRPINSCKTTETYVCFSKESQTKLKFAAIDASLFASSDALKKGDVLKTTFPKGGEGGLERSDGWSGAKRRQHTAYPNS